MNRYQNAKQFKRELDENRLEACYLFLGEEEGEKEKCINRIILMAFDDPADRAQAAARFHVENGEFMQAADFALSPPLFSSRRVCVMYRIDALPQTMQGAVLSDILRDLPSSTILIMTAEGARPPSFIEKHIGGFKVVQFWRYFENDLHQYVAATVRRMGFAIDDEAVRLLIERTGNDIKKIDEAIDMIRFSGIAGPVDAASVAMLVDDVRDASLNDFIDALFKRQPRALDILRRMRDENVAEIGVLFRILRQAEIMERYYDYAESGLSASEAMDKAGVFAKNREQFSQYLRRFPRERLRKLIAGIGETDYLLKGGTEWKGLIDNPLFELAAREVLDT